MSILQASAPLNMAGRIVAGAAPCIVLAAASLPVAGLSGLPTMLVAIILGMLANPLLRGERWVAGVDFCMRPLLRTGVALLGAQVSIDQILDLGGNTVGMVVAGMAATLAFGALAGLLLRLGLPFGVLTGGAVAICGASAALAVSAVLPKGACSERQTLYTVVAVTTLSTLAMVAYPWIALSLGLSDREVGIFLGGSIHDVAQVVGAGYSVSTEAGDVATVTKLLRVALLAPAALLLASAFSTGVRGRSLRVVPGFLIGFAALALLTGTGAIPEGVRAALSTTAAWCLTTAMVAFGIRTTIGGLLAVGPRAAILVVAETLLLAFWLLAWLGVPQLASGRW